MSAEEGAALPPTAGTDKVQAPKPAATFSSFINKNTTGKKFAPKAARRRPGAAPAAAAPKPAAQEPAAPAVEVEAQTTQPDREPTTAPSEPTPAVQLPTPAPTQEPVAQDAPRTAIAPTESVAAVPGPSRVNEPTPVVAGSLPAPEPTSAQVEEATVHSEPTPAIELNQVVQDRTTGRASKRRRVNPPAPGDFTVPDTVEPNATETSTQAEADIVSDRVPEAAAVEETEPSANGIETHLEDPSAQETEAPRPRKRRTLPWNAVNRPQVEEEEAAPPPAKKARKPPKPRGKKKAAATEEAQDGQETEQQEDDEEIEAAPVRKRPSAKARGRRRADEPPVEDGEEAPAPAKRARKTRKIKSRATIVDSDAEDDAEVDPEEDQELVVRRKPRKPRQKSRSAQEGEDEDGQDGSRLKRKGRPPREATPPDAEDNEIDPDITFMDSLASRNIRVGKLSTRERKMREIDWVAVRQRQREEDLKEVKSTKELEKAEEALNAEQTQSSGVALRVNQFGEIVQEVPTTMNGEDEATRNFGNMVVVEEENLTQRITNRSFMKNNKRFPNDFILPGQGKRWTGEDTKRFYTGLRNFGTDFQMISHMFPGYPRRSIKLKFTREERDNPKDVREALLGRSQIVQNWDKFIEHSQMDEEKLDAVDEIKRQMDEVEEDYRKQIEEAKAEAAARRDQQRLAGVLDEEEGGEKENGDAKGKKKGKGKGKQVAFQEEQGVEIVGMVDDDPSWGQ